MRSRRTIGAALGLLLMAAGSAGTACGSDQTRVSTDGTGGGARGAAPEPRDPVTPGVEQHTAEEMECLGIPNEPIDPADTIPPVVPPPELPDMTPLPPGTPRPGAATPEAQQAAEQVVAADPQLGPIVKQRNAALAEAVEWVNVEQKPVGIILAYSFEPPVKLPSDRGQIQYKLEDPDDPESEEEVFGPDGRQQLEPVVDRRRFDEARYAAIYIDTKRGSIYVVEANSFDFDNPCREVIG